MKAKRENAGCTKVPHWRGFGSKHKGSLQKETTDVWKWYLEFFKEVIRLDSAEDAILGQACEPSQDCPVQLSYAQKSTIAKVTITRNKTVSSYDLSCSVPLPSEWFISGEGLQGKKSGDLHLNFIVKVYLEDRPEPERFGLSEYSNLKLRIGVKVYVGKSRRLNVSDAQSVLPWVRGTIVHELRHLWYKHYFPATDPINKYERKYPKGKTPAEYNFKDWLLYFGETKELSPRVDQIASYARDRKLCATEAFKAIVNYRIRTKGAVAVQKGDKFKGSMEELVRKIIEDQVAEFNKRYPRNQVVLEQVLPDKSWFSEFGSSLFSGASDS
jgi:hypothetical protein